MQQKIKAFLIFFIISVLLVTVWFKEGKILATGEVGLVFHNIANQASFFQHTWTEGAIGSPSPWGIASIPFYSFLMFLNSLQIPEFIIQAIFFMCCLVLSQTGTYLLCMQLDQTTEKSRSKELGYIVAAVFYISNLFFLANILNRFQYTFAIFYTLIPWLVYFQLKILYQNQFAYIALSLLIMVGASYALSSIPLTLLTWGILASVTVLYLCSRKSKLEYLKSAAVFAVLSIGWISLNVWWIFPLMRISATTTYFTQEAYNATGNIQSFMIISQRHGNVGNIVRLVNAEFFENMQTVWGNWYHHPLMIVLTFIPAVLAFSTLWIRQKPTYIKFFLTMAILAVFFAKGAAAPFGGLFLFLFEHIRILEAFRNPFEKIGLIIPLLYAPLIAFAINKMYLPSAKIVSLIIIIVISWPIWTAKVFSGPVPPQNDPRIGYKVEVPAYYDQLDQYFKSQPAEFRVLALPFNGEGMTHTWEYGYAGVEVYNGIFNRPMISLSTGIPFLKPIAEQIEPLLFNHPNEFTNFLQHHNIRYLIVRSDVDTKRRDLTSPQLLNETLAQYPSLRHVQKFGELDLYQLQSEDELPKIYPSNTIVTYPQNQLHPYTHINPYVETQSTTLVVSNATDKISPFVQEAVYSSVRATETEKLAADTRIPIKHFEVSSENVIAELPFIKHLPGTWQYSVSQAKEQWDEFWAGGTWQDKQFRALKRASKRLHEIYLSQQRSQPITSLALEYATSMNTVSNAYIYESSGVQQELRRHLMVLELIQQANATEFNTTVLPKIANRIDDIIKYGIPLTVADQIIYTYPTYEIDVPEDGDYSFVVSTTETSNTPLFSSNIVLVNGEIKNISKNATQTLQLKQGKNKLIFNEDKVRSLYKDYVQERNIVSKRSIQTAQSNSLPTITFKKESSAFYRATVSNAISPFMLTFSESYHPLWQAKINGKPLEQENHFLVNGYANAWLLEQQGDYDVELYFTAEDEFTRGITYAQFGVLPILLAIVLLYRVKWNMQ